MISVLQTSEGLKFEALMRSRNDAGRLNSACQVTVMKTGMKTVMKTVMRTVMKAAVRMESLSDTLVK